MFKIITRIFIIIWLKFFSVTTVGLFLIASFGDIVNNILRNKYSYLEIFNNLLYNSSNIISRIIPISCLIASLFTFNHLRTHSELIAILSSGFPKKKIAKILLFLGLFAFSLQFYNVAYYAPYLSKIKTENLENSAVVNDPGEELSTQALWFKGSDYFGSFLFYDKKNNVLANPEIFLFEKSYLQKIISAREASYMDHGSWLLKDVKILSQLAKKGTFPIEESFEQYQVNLKKEIEDFNQYQEGIYALGIRSLFKFISQLKKTGLNVNEYLILFYDKIAVSLSCIIFTLFPLSGLTQISQRMSSPGKSILLALIFSLVFWIGASSLQSFGLDNFINPILASFTLHVAMFVYIVKVYFSLEKLS